MTAWQKSIICFLAVSAFILAAIGFEVVRSAGESGREDARRSLLSLSAGAARVDALALAVGSGDLRQYDPLVTAVAEVQREVAAAEAAEPVLLQNAGVAKLRDAVNNRVKKIEEMKSLRSALNNTEMHLPELLGQQRDDVGADPNVRLELALVDFTLAKRSEPLRAARTALAHDDPLFGHVDVLETKAPGLIARATDVRDEPLTSHVVQVADAYDDATAREADRARKVCIVLLIGALLSSIAWLWVARR